MPDSERFLLEQAPQGKSIPPIPRCPATFQLGNAISLYLEYTGQGCGYEELGGWRCDTAYTLAAVLSGYAYMPGCTRESREDTARTLQAFGLDCRLRFTTPLRGDFLHYEEMKGAIRRALMEQGRPVMACGLAEQSFGCLIVGYEQGGEVLTGWSYPAFDFSPGALPVLTCCEQWYRAEASFLLVDECRGVPELCELYRQATHQAYRSGVQQNDILLKGLEEWARLLRLDHAGCVAEVRRTLRVPGSWEVLTFDNLTQETIEGALLSMADPLWCDYAERRYYAANFLRQAAAYFPERGDEMRAIAQLYQPIDALMHEYDGLSGHGGQQDAVDAAVFWKPEVRRQLAGLVERCREQEIEIAARMRALLAHWRP